MEIDLEQLKSLLKAFDEHSLTELTLKKDDEKIIIRREPAQVAATHPVSPPTVTSATSMAAPGAAPHEQAAAEGEAKEEEGEYITSPFVGTFYRAPSPTAKPFVEKGEAVQSGQPLCIVEAMKLMNEIEAEFPCTILDILVENGKPVEYGQRLFKIKRG